VSQRVLILGGGVAGLAAALAHHEAGWKVHVVESRPRLGGRAWSRSKGPGLPDLDNGPHVILGCYHSFRRLLQSLGSEGLFHQPGALGLAFVSPGGRVQRLAPPRLPAPLHLAVGLLSIDGLGWRERLGLLRTGLLPFGPLPPPSESLSAWMQRKGIRGASSSILITPLCRAIMNVEPDQASARLFVATLREAFLGGRRHSALWAPMASWGEILDQPAQALFARVGVELSLETRVAALKSREGLSPVVLLRDGTRLADQDRVVCALPWQATSQLLAGAGVDFVSRWGQDIQPAPIVTVHLSLAEGDLPFEDAVMGLVDGAPFHFLVRRSDELGRGLPGHPVGMLAGAAFDLDGLPAREIVCIALDQLSVFIGREERWPPEVAESARVIREKDATIRAMPDVQELRPRPGPGPLPGLMVCGDWTDTGLPSTLEGAARSGFALPVGGAS